MSDVACEGHIISLEKFTAGTIIAIIGAAIILTVTTAGLLSVNQTVSSSGTVSTVNVGVYTDSSATTNVTSLNWGTLAPGDTVTRSVYVKNTGSNQITLSMSKTNWNPTGANGPITLTWNRESNTLNPGSGTTATFTLTVSPSITGITNFSVDIVVTGTG